MFGNQNIKFRHLLFAIVLFMLLVVVSFGAGFLTSNYLPVFSGVKDFSELLQSFSLIKNHYYGILPETKDVEYGMIRGMLEVVGDPYTILVEPAQNELQTDQLTGSFGGIGARLEWDADGNLLLYPFPESAAQKAGIQEGDRLLAVDDLKIQKEMTAEEVQAAIRGKVGETVKLSLARAPDYSELSLNVIREKINLPSVTWNFAAQDQRVGIIQVNIIAATTPDEVKEAVHDLQTRQAEYFILDLRNNSGGLLVAGIETAELFLKEGVVIQQQYRDQPVEEIISDEDGLFTNLPITVLVNEYSASAAEIIAGALQGRQRAALIGTNSYGKDTIQLVFDLNDGSSLHVTTAQWWIPGLNYSIHGQGLIPDVSLSIEEANSQAAIDAAIRYMVK